MPVLRHLRDYDHTLARRDAGAGFRVALLALPEALVFALVAGLPPEHGVYAAITGMALGAVFSDSRHASLGPSLTTAILLLSTFSHLGVPRAQRPEMLSLLLAVTAVILIGGAWLRLAPLTRFVSRSVTTGFVAAAGCVVAATQLKHVLGLDLPETSVFLENIAGVIDALPQVRWETLLIACVTAGGYLALALRMPGAPAAIVSLGLGALTAWLLARGGYATDAVSRLHLAFSPTAPADLDFGRSGVLVNSALALALLTLVETSVVGRSFAARAGDRFDASQQMWALGATNLGNAVFSGMPASVSLSRSRLSRRFRAATPFAGIFAAACCGGLFVVGIPVLAFVPVASLAALAMVLATEIVSRHYLHVILRASAADATVLLVTWGAGLLFRLDVALYIGAGTSIVFFLRKVGVPQLEEYGFTEQGQLAAVDQKAERPIPDISIVHVEGDLFFGAAEIFLEQMRRVCDDPNLKVIVLRVRNAHHLDATCALAIEEFLRFARQRGRHVIVSGAHRGIYRVFRRSGLLALLGRENFFMNSPSNPTIATRNALRRAQKLLGTRQANIRIYVDPTKKPAGADESPAAAGGPPA
ncbi:MAG: SulP family inorganic anion transporter [Opitutaceae bacterium]|nr:SulP family inorganic anion transporter [Opitutaceae bacterium]